MDGRPDPAELLDRARREERAGGQGGPRGRLKIFFGMAPGVGKTYAMLAAGRRMAGQGVDVVVGVVETHGRAETEELLLGLDILARRRVEYRGAGGAAEPVWLAEFDADAAIARRPDILLVDELAHTNAPGSRREKRWQDVRDCLNAGIHVYTTLNVQHIESLNDVVAQITGVAVRETVPDRVVDEADEIELVDVPVDVLHERLRAGKVYGADGAARAVDPSDGFFRRGNLTALRELALRRTAAWVDSEMRRYRDDRAIRAVWPAGERVLVAVSPSPMSGKLVRAAKRMARVLHADLLAVYVESPRMARLSSADRERLMRTFRLAESLGATTTTLSGPDAARELVAFARSKNVGRIVVGKTERSRLREALRGSFVGNVIRESGDIDVYVIRGDAADASPDGDPAGTAGAATGSGRHRPVLMRAALTGLIVAGATGVARIFHAGPDLSEEAMVLLAGVIVASLTLGRWPAVLATVLSIGVFNFLFVEPLYTFAVHDSRSFVAFGVMLAAGVTIGTLAARSREQAATARERERRTASLYAAARELASAQDISEVAAAGAKHLHDALGGDVVISTFGPDRSVLEVAASAGSPDWFDARERGVARWAVDHQAAAGLGTRTLPASAARHAPLRGSQEIVGAVSLRPAGGVGLNTAGLLLLEAMSSQVAAAMERVSLIESRQAARLEAERERLRSALLSSVSHDLRTPLASITGAASALEEGSAIDARARAGLVRTIVEESARLSDLIANLVFATRLEAGGVELAREWTTIEEVVGVGLARHREALSSRPFRVQLPADLPMIHVDNAMLPQVVHNLIENALRYTPAGTPIAVTAWSTPTHVVVKVADEGPGLSEDESARVFQRFYRGRPAQAGGPVGSGMGLGLTICEGIIRAHGGRIWIEPNIPRGAGFLFSLPLDPPPPAPPREERAAAELAEGDRP